MKPFLRRFLIGYVLRRKDSERPVSSYYLAKSYKNLVFLGRTYFKNVFLILIGICSAAFGLKGFLLPNRFVDGGATGISLLVSLITGIPLYLLVLLVNIPFIVLAYSLVGKNFALKTALAISGLSVALALIDFPQVTSDTLLVSIFGGFFLGAGIGFAVRGGAVIDGTEVLAIHLSRKLGLTIGDIIVVINVLIFSAAAYLLSIERALYSMITYLAASRTLDFVIEGIDEYIGVTIVSGHSEAIRQMVLEKMGRGVTIFKGQRGYGPPGSGKDVDIIYTVITRLEINRLTVEIQKIEPSAFVVMHSVKDTRGGMVKKRPFKH